MQEQQLTACAVAPNPVFAPKPKPLDEAGVPPNKPPLWLVAVLPNRPPGCETNELAETNVEAARTGMLESSAGGGGGEKSCSRHFNSCSSLIFALHSLCFDLLQTGLFRQHLCSVRSLLQSLWWRLWLLWHHQTRVCLQPQTKTSLDSVWMQITHPWLLCSMCLQQITKIILEHVRDTTRCLVSV